MPDIVHSLKSLYKVGYLALIKTEGLSQACQAAKMERCGRINMPFS